MAEVELQPAVATLVAAVVEVDGKLAFPPDATAAFRAATRGVDKAQSALLVEHLLAFTAKAARLGALDEDFIEAVAGLIVELTGSAEAASDAFRGAGLDAAAAAVIGRSGATRAPAAAAAPAPKPVAVKRGLKRD